MDVTVLPILAQPGFLRTQAPLYADLILVLEIAMGVVLLVGAFLARTRKYHAHACCQSFVVVLNLIMVLLVMLPSFRVRIAPKIPTKTGQSLLFTGNSTRGSGKRGGNRCNLHFARGRHEAVAQSIAPGPIQILDAHRPGPLVGDAAIGLRDLRAMVYPVAPEPVFLQRQA